MRRWYFGLGVLLFACRVSSAGPSLVAETMIHAQLDDALTLDAFAGADTSGPLQYNYQYDTSSGAFSYNLVSGQTYFGMPLSLSAVGTYDSSTATFNWTETGQIGATTITGTSLATWSGDPTASILASVMYNGLTVSISGNLSVDDMAGTSSGQLMLTAPGLSASVTASDQVPPGSRNFRVQGLPPGFPPIIGSFFGVPTEGSGVSGTSTVVLPEPGTFAVSAVGLIALFRRPSRSARTP